MTRVHKYSNLANIVDMKFSDTTLNKAIKSSNSEELAWKKEYIFSAIDEVVVSGRAILGGDVWAIMKKSDSDFVLTHIDPVNIAVGVIKGKDGKDYVFSWHLDKEKGELWEEYVDRSKKETLKAINAMNAQESVSPELQKVIYYNLVFADKTEYENLDKKQTRPTYLVSISKNLLEYLYKTLERGY